MKNILENTVKEVNSLSIVPIEKIPEIDLYMDQVTTFIENALYPYKRSKEDKILTKTMINNYATAKIFPPPQKKKYTKNHMMLLIMIYHLKSILSITDISHLLKPITEEMIQNDNSTILEMIYRDFVLLQQENKEILSQLPFGVFSAETAVNLEKYKEETIQQIVIVLRLALYANIHKKAAEKVLDIYIHPLKKI